MRVRRTLGDRRNLQSGKQGKSRSAVRNSFGSDIHTVTPSSGAFSGADFSRQNDTFARFHARHVPLAAPAPTSGTLAVGTIKAMREPARDDVDTPSLPQRIINAHAIEAIRRMETAEVVAHHGERGRAREEVLRQYLVETVPEGFTVATGFIIDCHGSQSRQQDLIIVRRDYHPKFQVGGAQFFPVEAVAAVVEVKSTLNTRTLREALTNARSVKALDRTGNGHNYIVSGGIGGRRDIDVDPDNDDHQIMSLIVAARCTINIQTAYRAFAEALEQEPRRTWPNAIAVADSWYLAYDVPPEHPRTHIQIATGVRLHERTQEANVEPLVDVVHDLWSWLRVVPLIDAAPLRYVRPSITTRVGTMPDARRLNDASGG